MRFALEKSCLHACPAIGRYTVWAEACSFAAYRTPMSSPAGDSEQQSAIMSFWCQRQFTNLMRLTGGRKFDAFQKERKMKTRKGKKKEGGKSEKSDDRVRRSSLAQMVGVGCQGNIEQAEQWKYGIIFWALIKCNLLPSSLTLFWHLQHCNWQLAGLSKRYENNLLTFVQTASTESSLRFDNSRFCTHLGCKEDTLRGLLT